MNQEKRNFNTFPPQSSTNRVVSEVGEHPWVKVYRQICISDSYTVDGVIITERAGISAGFKGIIDDFRDSTTIHQSTAFHAFERMQEALETGRKLIEPGEAKL